MNELTNQHNKTSFLKRKSQIKFKKLYQSLYICSTYFKEVLSMSLIRINTTRKISNSNNKQNLQVTKR